MATILTDSLPVLRQGSTGQHVALLQRLMAMAGHDPGSADGIFGAKTAAAVRGYQSRNHIGIDGVAGPATWGMLAQPVPMGDTAGGAHKVTERFRLGEFGCRHCGWVVLLYLPDLAGILEDVRATIGGWPLIITSGYRCRVHNRDIGGSPVSQHLLGKAADVVAPIALAGDIQGRVADAAEGALGKRGGVLRYPKTKFTHIDIRAGHSRGYME